MPALPPSRWCDRRQHLKNLLTLGIFLGSGVPSAGQLGELQPTVGPPVLPLVTLPSPVEEKPVTPVMRPPKAAPLVSRDRLPLQTKGRYIVDNLHYRVKWACVNYAGAYFTSHVVGGLDKQPIASIARQISQMGFNCVRLPYSTEGWETNPVIKDKRLTANPELQGGKRFREVFQATVQALTDEGLMVIINNHNSKSGWCCTIDQDEGFWHVPEYNESQWIASLTGLAQLFRNNPLVVAFDVRNEPHDIRWKFMTWGDGDPETDWAAAATRAGNALLDVNPELLIVVSALCFCMDLGPIKLHPIQLQLDHRVVYEVHNYIEFQLATLVTNNIMSWTAIQRLCWVLQILFLLVVVASVNLWQRLGSPRPPKGARTLTFFSWFLVAVLCVTGLFVGMYCFYRLYCNYYARTFLVYLIEICLVLLLAGIGGFAMSVVRWRMSQLQRAADLSPLVSNSEDEDESEDDEQRTPSKASSLPEMGRRESHFHFGEEGWNSMEVAKRLVLVRGAARLSEPVPWDCGLCCGLQLCCASGFLGLLVVMCCIYAHVADSYFYLQLTFDHKWAFALDGGHEYTAPVWLGEFGQNTRGRYWQHLMSYMAVRDVDFAYWPLNGDKFSSGYFDLQGQWVDFPEPRWEDESFGMLERDYKTLRHAWKLQDLQQIMASPAGWVPDSYPCDREVLGNACGG